jgi:hypothetical protein
MSRVILLGPQRLKPSVGTVIRDLGLVGPLCTITAGWEEREAEDEELNAALGCPVTNLRLFARAERVFRAHPGLLEAVQRHHDRLRKTQEIYRLRLDHAMGAVRALVRHEGDEALLEPQRISALDAVRTLDREHLDRKADAQRAFEAEIGLERYDTLRRERQEVHDLLKRGQAVVIPGGHVAVLRNRLWLFDVASALRDRVVITWSAGAMIFSEVIVLFHDDPAQGQGAAEVFERGVGFHEGIVPLPHAHRRLQLQDATRVSLLARRFAPLQCVVLHDGCRLDWNGDRWTPHDTIQVLTAEGTLVAMTAGAGVC